MEYTFDEVAELLDEMSEHFPPIFFETLNGGILLQEEEKTDPLFPKGDMCFLGEYVRDEYMGCYINLYYGSFLSIAKNEDWTEEDWRDELYKTLSHELTHHIEFLANTHGLDDKDEEQFRKYWKEFHLND